MTDARSLPFGGYADAQMGDAPLPERFRRHADSLERARRSALYVTMMRAAAEDIEAGGRVADLFAGVRVPPGAVPSLRFLGALHQLVLAGDAPELAAFYPSAGGTRTRDGVWPVALDALGHHAEWVRGRLQRTVQTNEPGRAAVLFPALLWLTGRYSLPIRLLEIGASAGLNLLADRFSYQVGNMALGAPGSPVRFVDPWTAPPDLDLASADRSLRIVEREGCDPTPLDPRAPTDRLTALSYIWPDETVRLERARAALQLAASDPPRVAAQAAQEWLPAALARRKDGELTVIWQSVMRQYVEPDAWEAIELAFRHALRTGNRRRPVVWLSMEPSDDHLANVELTLKTEPEEPARLLARCGDHGPPVIWERAPSPPPHSPPVSSDGAPPPDPESGPSR